MVAIGPRLRPARRTSYLRCERAQGWRRTRIAAVPRHRARDDGGLDPLALDAVGAGAAAPELRRPCPRSRTDRRGGGRPDRRVRQVRPRGPRDPCARRADGAAGRPRLYRHVRNPMYLAVTATIVGQALFLGRWELLAYAASSWARRPRSCAGTRNPRCESSSAPSTRPIDARSRAGGHASSRGRPRLTHRMHPPSVSHVPFATNPIDQVRTFFEDSGGNGPPVLVRIAHRTPEYAKTSPLARGFGASSD